MKKLIYFTSVAALTAILFACNQNDQENDMQDVPEEKGTTIDPNAEKSDYDNNNDTTRTNSY